MSAPWARVPPGPPFGTCTHRCLPLQPFNSREGGDAGSVRKSAGSQVPLSSVGARLYVPATCQRPTAAEFAQRPCHLGSGRGARFVATRTCAELATPQGQEWVLSYLSEEMGMTPEEAREAEAKATVWRVVSGNTLRIAQEKLRIKEEDVRALQAVVAQVTDVSDGGKWAVAVKRWPTVLTVEAEAAREVLLYLRESLGMSREELGTIVRALPVVLSLSVDGTLKPSVQYLCSLGPTVRKNVASIVTKAPQVLSCSVESRLRPTVDYLCSLGPQMGSGLDGILSRAPEVLFCDPKPAVEYLCCLGPEMRGCVDLVVEKDPWLLQLSVKDSLEPVVEYLCSLGPGVRRRISGIVKTHPWLLGLSVEGDLKPTVEYLCSLGRDVRDNIGSIIIRHPQVLSYSVEQNLRPIVQYLSILELRSGTDIVKHPNAPAEASLSPELRGLVSRHPSVLGLSVEADLKPTVEYLCGLGPEVRNNIGSIIRRAPKVLSCSMYGNLKPIMQALCSLGLGVSDIAGSVIQKNPDVLLSSLDKGQKPHWPNLDFLLEQGARLSSIYMPKLSVSALKPSWCFLLRCCGRQRCDVRM